MFEHYHISPIFLYILLRFRNKMLLVGAKPEVESGNMYVFCFGLILY